MQRRDRQRVELSVAVRPIADLEEATLRDDVDKIPDDEAAVHVVARVRVVRHKVRPVVNNLPVAGDGLVRELLLRPVQPSFFELRKRRQGSCCTYVS